MTGMACYATRSGNHQPEEATTDLCCDHDRTALQCGLLIIESAELDKTIPKALRTHSRCENNLFKPIVGPT